VLSNGDHGVQMMCLRPKRAALGGCDHEHASV
jgi:hypothetical protein